MIFNLSFLCRWDLKDEIAAEVRDEILLLDRLMMVAVAVAVASGAAAAAAEMVMGASFMWEIWRFRLRVKICANTLGRCAYCLASS